MIQTLKNSITEAETNRSLPSIQHVVEMSKMVAQIDTSRILIDTFQTVDRYEKNLNQNLWIII